MEERIKDYEKFIAKAAKHPTKDLAIYHQEMIQNFQHERAIHLAITLFFCALALISIGLSACFIVWYPDLWLTCLPIHLVTLILAGISVAYVRHYYFLENHIQKLYDYNAELHQISQNHPNKKESLAPQN